MLMDLELSAAVYDDDVICCKMQHNIPANSAADGTL